MKGIQRRTLFLAMGKFNNVKRYEFETNMRFGASLYPEYFSIKTDTPLWKIVELITLLVAKPNIW